MARADRTTKALARTSGETGRAVDHLGAVSRGVGGTVGRTAVNFGDLARRMLEAARNAAGFGRAAEGAGSGARALGGAVSGVSGALGLLGKAAAVLSVVQLGKEAVDAAVKFDGYRAALTAALGTTQAAGKEFRSLKDIARLPGIGLEEATKSFLQYKNAGLDTLKINKLISGVGKANARSAGGLEDFGEANRQLSQIFQAGKITEDNLSVIKERVPAIAGAIREEFGTPTAEGLKKAGVSSEQFLDRLSARLEKMNGVAATSRNAFDNFGDSAKNALASAGTLLLPAVTAGLDKAADLLGKITEGIDAFAASKDGKAVFGNISAAFESLRASAVKVGDVIGSAFQKAGVTLTSGDLIAGVKRLSEGLAQGAAAVQRFVGSAGFQQFAERSAAGLVKLGEAARAAFSKVAEWSRPVVTWVRENWPLVTRTAATVVNTVTELWRRHGPAILAVVRPVWDEVKAVVGTAGKLIGDALRLVMQVINGDWKGAWGTFNDAVSVSAGFVARTVGNLSALVKGGLNLAVRAVLEIGGRFLTAAKGIGKNIVDGIVGGIREKVGAVGDAARTVAETVRATIAIRLIIRSPSRVMMKMGRDTSLGFALGILSGKGQVQAAIQEVVGQVLESRKYAADRLADARRNLLVAKYGENSAPVILNDQPIMGRDNARRLEKQLAAFAKSQARQDRLTEAGKNIAEWAKESGYRMAPVPVPAAPVLSPGAERPAPVDPTANAPAGSIPTRPGALSRSLASVVLFFGRNMSGAIEGVFDGGGIRATVRRFAEGVGSALKQSVSDSLSSFLAKSAKRLAESIGTGIWERAIAPDMKRLGGEIGQMLNASTSGAVAAAGQVLSASYGLLSALGALGGKRKRGGLFGGLLGLAAGLLIPGGGLALGLKFAGLGSSFVSAIGSGNLSEILGAGIAGAASLGAIRLPAREPSVPTAGFGGGGFAADPSSQPLGGGGFGGGGFGKYGPSRAVQVNQNNWTVHQASDFPQIADQTARSIEQRLSF
jgi:tape measure domain-containing protein